MHFKNGVIYFFFTILIAFIGCKGKEESHENVSENKAEVSKQFIAAPEVNGDSTYLFVKQQVAFGPRIPGSKSHAQCALWIENKLRSYIPDVQVQKGAATTFDGKRYDIKNIIGTYNPSATKRILLCAHWDTRPFADNDSGPNKNKPFDGANDGASGVGVLLEIARQLQISKPGIGVDVIFFDLEDYGQPEESTYPQMENSWCLGSQYWAKNPHKQGYYAKFGILLDMVGGKDAVFPKEGTSVYFAPGVVDKVWNVASRLGYGSYFINATTGQTTDDHLYVNQVANIPCIDIVHYNNVTGRYYDQHHKVGDNMTQIVPAVLKMTGQTVLQVLYDEVE